MWSDETRHETRVAMASLPELPEGRLAKPWTRDQQYYFEDGSCILLVEDTLFNVHRSILSRDGSTFFGTLFSVPQGDSNPQGKTDNHPIVLEGESASEFRSFLSAIYGLPSELQALTSPTADLPTLISIARKANKFEFRSLETWALEAIQQYVNQQPSPIIQAIPCPTSYVYAPSDSFSGAGLTSSSGNDNLDESRGGLKTTQPLTSLISLAQLCNHAPLLNTMVNTLRELMSSSIQYAYLAMTLSDELDLKSLRGPAYLEVMQKAEIIQPLELDFNEPSSSFAGNSAASDSPSANASASTSGSVLASSSNVHLAIPGGVASTASNNTLVLGAMANNLAPLSSMPVHAFYLASSSAASSSSSSPNNSSSTSSSATSSHNSSSALTTHTFNSPQRPAKKRHLCSLPLTAAQRLRLLSGYYLLSQCWTSLRLSPPTFEHAEACATTWHQQGCAQAWEAFWKEKTTKSDWGGGGGHGGSDADWRYGGRGGGHLGEADVLGRLKVVQREFEKWGSAAYMHGECRVSARKRIADIVQIIEERLGEYFVGAGA